MNTTASTVIQKYNVNTIGQGEITLLLAHGYGCDQIVWKYLTPFFKNYKIVLFDFIGAGKSDKSFYDRAKYNSLQGYADDVIEICRELQLTNVVFIGHSVSSMIGALASIKAPEAFNKLVFIGPSPCFISKDNYIGGFTEQDIDTLLELMDDDFITWANNTAPIIMGAKNPTQLKEELVDNFCSWDQEIAKDFAHVTFKADHRKDLPRVPVRSLTLQCSEDLLAPVSVGEYINAYTPRNTMVILKATGHCPHMSAPEETAEAILAFIEQ